MIEQETGWGDVYVQAETKEDYRLLFNKGLALMADLDAYTISLPVADKAEWVAALLNGKFTQGQGRLKTVLKPPEGSLYANVKDKYRHCCLGVLCELQGVEQTNVAGISAIQFEEQTSVLPAVMRNKFGIDDVGTFILTFTVFGQMFGQRHNLASLNDGGFSFSQIADVINYFF